jgi:hypothetical protein
MEIIMKNWQRVAYHWVENVFSPENAANPNERSERFGEEALELLQARGVSRERVHELVDYVYNRPAGEVPQELGGVMHTLLVLAEQGKLDLWECFRTEMHRVSQPEVMAKCRIKWLDKQRQGMSSP